jgi:esterase/lipase superfamily enzyme
VGKVKTIHPLGKVACQLLLRHHAANLLQTSGYVSHMFFYGGAFNIKSFLDGFHNDDVFYNSPRIIYMD